MAALVPIESVTSPTQFMTLAEHGKIIDGLNPSTSEPQKASAIRARSLNVKLGMGSFHSSSSPLSSWGEFKLESCLS
ncbi:MAG: hypothetical protein M1835_001937 [Candelina submexicana]|nr:MAG: hypothetical protein M1835_001937 [Candelina submexicana]